MRSFNKNETQNILAKAAELEMSRSLDGGNDGLTEPEIIELAKESGISTSSIQLAIQSFNTPTFKHSFKWYNLTSKIEHTEYVDVHLKSDHISNILSLLRTEENTLGEKKIESDKLSWSVEKPEFESLNVVIETENDITSITYSKEWHGHAELLTLVAFIIALIAAGILAYYGLDKIFILLISTLVGLLGFSDTLFFLKHKFDKQKQKLENILLGLRKILLSSHEKDFSIEIDEGNNISTINQSKIRS